jgi:hypothetical protein
LNNLHTQVTISKTTAKDTSTISTCTESEKKQGFRNLYLFYNIKEYSICDKIYKNLRRYIIFKINTYI